MQTEAILDSRGTPRNERRERLAAYLRFIKLEHALFSLPVLFGGSLLAAGGWPGARVVLFVLLAGTGARVLAVTLNRLMDLKVDRKNPRTAGRELVTGTLSVWDAVLVAVAGLVLYVWSARELSEFCLLWSWVPVLLFAVYPTLKHFTALSHFGLGLAWAMAPLGGWFAVRPGFEGCWPAVVLGCFSFFWLAGFDIIYATMDEEFDRREGLFSLPAKLGRRKALNISSALHWGAFLALVSLYFASLTGAWAAFLLLLAGLLLFLEHLFVHKVHLAFFKINVVIGIVVLMMISVGVGLEF